MIKIYTFENKVTKHTLIVEAGENNKTNELIKAIRHEPRYDINKEFRNIKNWVQINVIE